MNLCKCGCGQKIVVYKHHKYSGIPAKRKFLNKEHFLIFLERKKGIFIKCKCKGCEKIFLVKNKCEVKERKYCSIFCYRKFASTEHLDKIRKSPNRLIGILKSWALRKKGKIVKCYICGKEYYLAPYRIKGRKNGKFFCSNKCFFKTSLLRNTGKTRFKKGHQNPLWVKEKVRQAISGEKNINWKGGITAFAEKIRKSPEYKEWRSKIYKRDNYTCVLCNDKTSNNFHADHYPIPFLE